MTEISPNVSNKLIETTKGVAEALGYFTKVADQRASTYLMGFGALVITLSVLLKIQLLGASVSKLQPSEFITLIISGSIFIVLGASMRLYIESKEMDMVRGNRDASVGIVEKSLGIAETLSKQAEQKKDKPGGV